MRTTISLSSGVLQRARVFAAKKRCSLSSLIEDALTEMMAKKKREPTPRRSPLPIVRGKPIPGVNYDSLADLLELSEK